ncbi:serine/threonine-protein phosphatase 4 regulatory subunit 1 isoform X2 [Osmerus eperlanus]|uniref:serine/threonine-protein phosphatase 4 regulatory subunit 1 isoform X2 n=1 Tax=Osmerus eperlanus TaxID=29151 RepID=UPI002E110439
MADISLLQEDSQEELDGSLDCVSQDEMLTPLGRLDKYLASENIFNRQMVVRSLLDTLKAVSEDERECIAVLERVARLADDSESTVRAELMEQVPHMAIFCQENVPAIPYAFSTYLLPIVVRYLADQNNQVRKTSQAALLVLLEQGLVERGDVEKLVCPVLVDLTAPDSNDDVKTEAMAIICKMAPMVGKDITERLFLPRFCEMCCDCRMFHVRKVCAANFGDMCSVVGGEATEELLLPRFFQLCSDNVWGVRKACAECFMTVSSATSQEVRRTKLSSLFISLISDPSRWVRQAAFQSLGQFISTFACPAPSQVDCTCDHTHNSIEERPVTMETLRTDFDRLEDSKHSPPCPWASGGHGDQPHSEDGGLCQVEEGIVDVAEEGGGEQGAEVMVEVIVDPDPYPAEKDPIETARAEKLEDTHTPEDTQTPEGVPGEDVPEPSARDTPPREAMSVDTGCAGSVVSVSEVRPAGGVPEQELYNSFHFWRTPIPDIDLELELLPPHGMSSQPWPSLGSPSLDTSLSSAPPPSVGPSLGRRQLEELIENLEPHIDDPDVKAQVDVLTAALKATAMEPGRGVRGQGVGFGLQDEYPGDESELSDGSFTQEDDRRSKQQDVVPQALLDQYLSMTDPSRAQTVDMEIAKHCAYSLPGVALTLGPHNWHCLRDTYETLASDMQWKVRRTLAFSIHELAGILGAQLTAADLVPIFNSFLKDLDEVRIGVLKHLYDFLKLLHQETRRKYLYQLQEFLVTDNSRNWRFRSELAEQLVRLLELYSGQDVYDYMRPLAFSLCTDRVSSVRWTSYKLVSEMIRKLGTCQSLLADLLSELVHKFCHSPKWSGRQAFALICQLSVEEECVSLEQFSEHLLAPLLQLCSDPVPNVRVLLAKTLRQSLLEREYFLHSASVHQEAMEQTLVALQTDLDKDVKYFASVHPGNTRLNDDAMSTTSSTY